VKCALCSRTDDSTDEVGWSVCDDCFCAEVPARSLKPSWTHVAQAIATVAITMAVFFLLAALYELRANADPGCGVDASGVCYTGPGMATPAPLPQLPQSVVNGDGSRMTCTFNYSVCWPAT